MSELRLNPLTGRWVTIATERATRPDEFPSTRLEVEDGKYTGEIATYMYAEEKALAIRQLAEVKGWDLADCFAYSDSVTDVPMLAEVGHPHAVNPDRDLRRHAVEHDWPVLVFDKPVALRSRVPVPSRPTLTALAVGGAVAVGGVIWAGARRRGQGA